jgi:hypothetical protein
MLCQLNVVEHFLIILQTLELLEATRTTIVQTLALISHQRVQCLLLPPLVIPNDPLHVVHLPEDPITVVVHVRQMSKTFIFDWLLSSDFVTRNSLDFPYFRRVARSIDDADDHIQWV